MSDFINFEQERERQLAKLDESLSLLHASQSAKTDWLTYDVKGFDPMMTPGDIISTFHQTRETTILQLQLDLTANMLQRMTLTSELLVTQMCLGLQAEQTPEGLIETLEEDTTAFEKMSSLRQEFMSFTYRVDAQDLAGILQEEPLRDMFNRMAENVHHYKNGLVPAGLRAFKEQELINKTFQLRAGFVDCVCNAAEIYHRSADDILINNVRLRKSIEEGIFALNSDLKISLREWDGDVEGDLARVRVILNAAQKYMRDLYEMGDGDSFDVFEAKHYTPASVLSLSGL